MKQKYLSLLPCAAALTVILASPVGATTDSPWLPSSGAIQTLTDQTLNFNGSQLSTQEITSIPGGINLDIVFNVGDGTLLGGDPFSRVAAQAFDMPNDFTPYDSYGYTVTSDRDVTFQSFIQTTDGFSFQEGSTFVPAGTPTMVFLEFDSFTFSQGDFVQSDVRAWGYQINGPNGNNGDPVGQYPASIQVVSKIPEPGTIALVGLASAGLAATVRRRR